MQNENIGFARHENQRILFSRKPNKGCILLDFQGYGDFSPELGNMEKRILSIIFKNYIRRKYYHSISS